MVNPDKVGHEWDFMRDDDDEGNEAYDVNHWQCKKCSLIVPVSWNDAPEMFSPNDPGPGFTHDGDYVPKRIQSCEEIQIWLMMKD